MASPSIFIYHEPQHSSLVRLELLVLSNPTGTMNTHCAKSSDTTSKKKKITAAQENEIIAMPSPT
jgi:hypothetical protein